MRGPSGVRPGGVWSKKIRLPVAVWTNWTFNKSHRVYGAVNSWTEAGSVEGVVALRNFTARRDTGQKKSWFRAMIGTAAPHVARCFGGDVQFLLQSTKISFGTFESDIFPSK